MKFATIIKNTTFLFLAVCVSFVMFSCEGDEGPIGPAGPVGATGATGAPGATGATGLSGSNGESSMSKTGHIQGTITGTRQDGTAFTETFKYEYTSEQYEGFHEGDDYAWIYRYSKPTYDAAYCEIRLKMVDRGLETEHITADHLYFYFYKEVTPNTMFRFNIGTGGVESSNSSYNAETGALSIDFTYTGTNNSTGNEVTVTGTFTTGQGKLYKNMISRKGS